MSVIEDHGGLEARLEPFTLYGIALRLGGGGDTGTRPGVCGLVSRKDVILYIET